MQEFRRRCQESQKRIVPEIHEASAEAELSRLAAWSEEETEEEKLLANLLAANECLTEALKMYDDLEREAAGIEERERVKNEKRVS